MSVLQNLVSHSETDSEVAVPCREEKEAGFLPLSVLLSAYLRGYLLNRLLYVSFCQDIWPLDFSTGIPEESGVRRPLVTHHAMKLAGHPLPAPRRFRLEAKQLLREWSLAWLAVVFLHCASSSMVGLSPAEADHTNMNNGKNFVKICKGSLTHLVHFIGKSSRLRCQENGQLL